MKQTSIPKTRFMTNPPFYIKPIFSNFSFFNTIFFYHFSVDKYIHCLYCIKCITYISTLNT
ncbi:transporter [Bacillus cereus]|nr:transporter [Bacillus cereus]PEQ43197.1 transporter [Bacillus cereus]PER33862.1 transporter [Bacillus cereus]PEW96601.1 transporter [Bacillus cereus]PEX97492.1 transporter [Bacillus cereus]